MDARRLTPQQIREYNSPLRWYHRWLYGYPKDGQFPTWKARWFKINFVERDKFAVGLGISFDHNPPREITLTIWRTQITWRLGNRGGVKARDAEAAMDWVKRNWEWLRA
jgi:hypothetical protein